MELSREEAVALKAVVDARVEDLDKMKKMYEIDIPSELPIKAVKAKLEDYLKKVVA